MYTPGPFNESRREILHALMREHPFATLIIGGNDGPLANHLPLYADAAGACLRGHVARANPIWRALAGGVPALAIFHGPHGYVSPSWYPTKHEHGRVAPTWNYAVVHARGVLRAVDDGHWLRGFLEQLTDHHEAGFETPWRVSDAPEAHVETLLAAIVGIELRIDHLQGKWKMSQNQPARNRAGVVAGLRQRDRDGDQALAALVERFDPDLPSPGGAR
ncbi:transcriptional regulator [Alcanivorax sp. N3-2A]|nr:transcriptional regulator [Alcanivorax sp. N3-2A]|tara:strand:- start:6486 stop:7139 length:654 start_codon:yes stop_codon:yes gene_type:complete